MLTKLIRGPPTPSRGPNAIGDRGLPLRDLIEVLEGLIRSRRTRSILLSRDGLDQRSNVADDRHPLLVPERVQLGQARVQAERTRGARRRDRQQAARGIARPELVRAAAY